MGALSTESSRITSLDAEAAVRLSPLPAALLNTGFVIARVNEAWSLLLGRTAASFEGKSLIDAVRGDERRALAILLENHGKGTEPVLRLYVHLAAAAPEPRSALLILHRLDDTGGNGVIAHIIDTGDSNTDDGTRAQLLAAIEQASWEWRRTFDAVETPIVIVNEDLTVARINRPARMLAGMEYSEIVGRPVAALEPAEPWRSIAQLSGEVQKTRAPAARQVKDSAAGTLDLLAMLFNAEDLHDGRVIVIVWDVTALVDLQTRFEQQRTMATIGALVAGVAHEVRNPLFGISATLDAMEQLATPELQEYFEVLRFEIDRMSELMRDLLVYGRPSAPNLTTFELHEIVDGAMRACTAQATRCGVLLKSSILSEGPVLADRDRLMRAVQNLIDNAVQHSPGGATVTIECFTSPARNPRNAHIRVTDQGTGFRADDLPRVFEPFFSRRKGGTGLGLALVQQIVTDHGGQVEAANSAAGGAAVSLTLPLARG